MLTIAVFRDILLLCPPPFYDSFSKIISIVAAFQPGGKVAAEVISHIISCPFLDAFLITEKPPFATDPIIKDKMKNSNIKMFKVLYEPRNQFSLIKRKYISERTPIILAAAKMKHTVSKKSEYFTIILAIIVFGIFPPFKLTLSTNRYWSRRNWVIGWKISRTRTCSRNCKVTRPVT
jgi:hypothetical protein